MFINNMELNLPNLCEYGWLELFTNDILLISL